MEEWWDQAEPAPYRLLIYLEAVRVQFLDSVYSLPQEQSRGNLREAEGRADQS